jgi:hypothetical protein
VSNEAPTDALRLATRFHETYERLAPSFGYETRQDTKKFDPETPNGRLMVAVCAELAAAPASPLPGGGWQDISTAPRQERVMLGHKDFKGWFCLAICNALGEWSYDDRPWGQQDAPDKEATHWMPLPAAPTGEPK